MTEEQIALGRRAIACNGWRWMPGMLTNHGARCLGRNLWVDRAEQGIFYADPNDGEVPDLTDSATLGCLLALVREAHGDPFVYSAPADGWFVGRGARDGVIAEGATEAAALVAALEAAP